MNWTSQFFQEMWFFFFLVEEWQINYGWQTFLQNLNQVSLSLQGKCLLPTMNFQLGSFPVLQDFANAIGDDKNESDFGIFYF